MSHDNLVLLLHTKILLGLGDPRKGEWLDLRDGVPVSPGGPELKVVHIKRRLTLAEEAVVGPVKDLRGTRQEINRANAVGRKVNVDPRELIRLR